MDGPRPRNAHLSEALDVLQFDDDVLASNFFKTEMTDEKECPEIRVNVTK